LQLFEAVLSEMRIGIPALSTPVDTKVYAEHGHPFFQRYEGNSDISGGFAIQSVSSFDKPITRMEIFTRLRNLSREPPGPYGTSVEFENVDTITTFFPHSLIRE
jgi:hypothetical protein